MLRGKNFVNEEVIQQLNQYDWFKRCAEKVWNCISKIIYPVISRSVSLSNLGSLIIRLNCHFAIVFMLVDFCLGWEIALTNQ